MVYTSSKPDMPPIPAALPASLPRRGLSPSTPVPPLEVTPQAGPSSVCLPRNSEQRLSSVLAHIAHLRKLDQESINRRREKRHAYRHKDKEEEGKGDMAQACMTCRRAKTKCLNRDGEPCARCMMSGEMCTYPPQKRRGRRTDTSLQDVLDQVENEITTLLLSGPDDDPPVPKLTNGLPASDPDEEEHSALQNPLGMLATAAIDQSVENTVRGPAKYWNSIYEVKAETDLNQDPVAMGLLTEEHLTRLIQFFFTYLRPFFMHLDPVVHTPVFLRLNSPFLTTAIASVASTYDPQSSHLCTTLFAHAQKLAAKAFEDGSKSLEVVQAYLTLLHWNIRFPPFWSDDRSWQWQGSAMRLATEVRLDLPPNKDTVKKYRAVEALGEEVVNRLFACRRRTYLLVSLSEISMAAQTGRADTTSGHRLFRVPTMPELAPDDPTNDRFVGCIDLTHIFAKALHSWHSADKEEAQAGDREKFLAGWKRDLDGWHKTHGGSDQLLEVLGTNNQIMLILLTLRIRGTHASTLDLLRQMYDHAARLISSVFNWYQQSDFYGPGGLAYAHDFLVVNIAYAAVLMYKLSHDQQVSSGQDASTHIDRALQVVDSIASVRPSVYVMPPGYSPPQDPTQADHPLRAVSTATLVAAQIRRLCQVPTAMLTAHDGQALGDFTSPIGNTRSLTDVVDAGMPDLSYFAQLPPRHYEFDFTLPNIPTADDTGAFLDFFSS